MSGITIRYFTKQIFDDYAREFGERKALSLVKSLSESSLLTKALQLWDSLDHIPTYQDLQKVVGAINWFVISRRESTAVGMLIALSRWDEHSNKSNRLARPDKVLQVAFDILSWLKVYEEEVMACKLLISVAASNRVEAVPRTTFLERVSKAVKISNIRSIEYEWEIDKVKRKRDLSATDLIISTVVGQKVWGGVFGEFPSEIISLIKSSCSKADDFEIAYLKFSVADKFKDSDDSLILVLAVEDMDSFDEEMGYLNLFEMLCLIDEDGITFQNAKQGWIVYLGVDKSEWKFF
ncbi:hypothetical protein ACFST9_04225 [Hymenobacter monticola]